MQSDLCSIDRKLLHTRLQSIANGNPYSILDIYGPGHTIYVAGTVAYITKCKPVEVKINPEFIPCTTELPVTVIKDNYTSFADPLTLVLKDVATIIPCSPVMPPAWKINGVWICKVPGMVCQTPSQLNTTVSRYTSLGDFTIGDGHPKFAPATLIRWSATRFQPAGPLR